MHDDVASQLAGEYQVRFNRETLLTFAMADYNALVGSEFEALRWAPYASNVISMARSVASNSYVIENRFEHHLPATFWDWVKSALPQALQRGPFEVRTVPVGLKITMRHMCPHLGNDPKACAEFLGEPGRLHGEDTLPTEVKRGEVPGVHE